MRFAWALLAVVVACGHPQPVKPAPKQLPVRAASDVQGRWATSDDMDWGYVLNIGADGTFDLVIDRNKLGRCEVKGSLTATGDRSFDLAYGRNDCDREASHTRAPVAITSFTGDALTIQIGDQTRTYSRAPSE